MTSTLHMSGWRALEAEKPSIQSHVAGQSGWGRTTKYKGLGKTWDGGNCDQEGLAKIGVDIVMMKIIINYHTEFQGDFAARRYIYLALREENPSLHTFSRRCSRSTENRICIPCMCCKIEALILYVGVQSAGTRVLQDTLLFSWPDTCCFSIGHWTFLFQEFIKHVEDSPR
jgi:hypothetical protein